MSGTLIIGAEEVLLIRDLDSYAASRPIPEGIQIAQQLRTFPVSRTVILTLSEDPAPALYWMQVNGFAKADVYMPHREDKNEPDWVKHLNMLEREPVTSLVLTGLPLLAKALIDRRYPVLLFQRPGGSELADRMTWAVMHERVLKRREALAEEEQKEEIRHD